MNDFFKQPDEKYPISMDYTDALNATETISSVSVKAYTTYGAITDVSTTLIDTTSIEGNICNAVVKAGTTGAKYKITFKATTDEGNIYEEDVWMKVQSI
jgi:hypothetical protein